MIPSADAAGFDADVRIGKGLRPLTQHGRLTIVGDVVRLSDSRGNVVATESIEHVEAAKIGFPGHGLRLTVGGAHYNIDAASKLRSHRLARFPSLSIQNTSTLTDAVIDYLARDQAAS